MKKLFTILILFGWASLACKGQGDARLKPDGSRLEALKIAFLTRKLNLSSEEAQRFWPIYNQYSAEIQQARQLYAQNKNEIELDESILTIKKKYNGEFSRALSPDKANQFFRAEKDFGNFVQKEWIERRQMRMQQRRPFSGN